MFILSCTFWNCWQLPSTVCLSPLPLLVCACVCVC
jgi:hypothetical protein